MLMVTQVAEDFLRSWGYLPIVLGTFLEGEAVLITAGTMVHEGELSLGPVLLAGCVGSVLWSQCWFRVGASIKAATLQRRVAQQVQVSLARWLDRNATFVVLGFRFVAGLGTVAPVFLGATRFPLRRFLVLDICGAALWSAAFTSLGAGLAGELGKLLGRPVRLWELLAAAVLLALGSSRAASLLRRAFLRTPSATASPSKKGTV